MREPLHPPYDNHEKNAVLGWKMKAGYHYKTEAFADNRGGQYPVELNFTRDGFRKWDVHRNDSVLGNVFVLGDSYVECVEASDDKVFYAYLHDSLPLSVYAYGAAGYGTAQEFMLLQQYIDSVKPKWVVLETCPNDYIDNYWELEKTAGYNFPQVRPYLTLDNKIEYHYNSRWFKRIKDYSLFLSFVFERCRQGLLNLKLIKEPEQAEGRMINEGRKFPEYDMACKLTENAFKNIKTLTESRNAKLIVLVLGHVPGRNDGMSEIVNACERNNIAVVSGSEALIMEAETRGEAIHSFDNYHYCNKGQKIVGNVLVDYFKQNELKTN